MASARRTYDTDNITLRTVFAKNPDNTNVPALRTLTADGAGGAYWAIPSSLGGIPAFNEIITTAASYTADLSYNKFRLLAGQNIGMTNGPAGSNQTTIYGKSFSQFDVSGENTLTAFNGGVVTAAVKFAGQDGIQITADPATNTLFFNGSAAVTSISTGIYGFSQVKITGQNSSITSSIQNFGGDFITATSPSTVLNLLGYNDIQLSTNVTTNSVFFTISTFTSQGYLAMSNTAYGAYPSSISTVSALYTPLSSFQSTSAYFQSVNQFNVSAIYSSINGLAMSTGQEFYLLTGLINARATIIQLNSEVSTLNTNIQSTSIGLGTLGYISSPGGGGGDIYDYQIASTLKESPIFSSVAIGYQAGYLNQTSNALALGYSAGFSNQGDSAIAMGWYAGSNTQMSHAIAIGSAAGYINQNTYAVALGYNAAYTTQGNSAIAIGPSAATSSQGDSSIAIGSSAGSVAQGIDCIAIGDATAFWNQADGAISIGTSAGFSNQSSNAIAIGYTAGLSNQNSNSIAIGNAAGIINQNYSAVAIGYQAGYDTQGSDSIAIGAYAGQTSQAPSSIVMSGLGSTLNAPNPGFYVAPLRDITTAKPLSLAYNPIAFEIGLTQTGNVSSLNVSSVKDPVSSLTVNVNALWSTLYSIYPACFA